MPTPKRVKKEIPIEEMTVKQLLKLPERDDGFRRAYQSILLVPSGDQHESGYGRIAVIGCWRDLNRKEFGEICAWPDDICWNTHESIAGDEHSLRTDCLYPSGVMRVWSRRVSFYVGDAFSSTEIKMIPTL